MHSSEPQFAPGFEETYLHLFINDEEERLAFLKKKQDEFLDIFSLYKKTGSSWIKEMLFQKAYELSVLDPNFTFHL